MTNFDMIKANVLEDHKKSVYNQEYYIQYGFMPSWEHKTDRDCGLKKWSTDTRWTQYQNGKISRMQAVNFASKRMRTTKEKELAKKLARLETIANAPDITEITVSVEWKRNTYWGNNPHATVYTDTGKNFGKAGGCGYDKRSAAVAEAFNKNNSILKLLYTLKENALRAGKSDVSKSACTGRNNTECCGYGAGYNSMPYFEGGVGVDCFWNILKKCGFETKCYYTNKTNTYVITKVEG